MNTKLFLISLVFLFSGFCFAERIPAKDREVIHDAARDRNLRTIKMLAESKDYKNNKAKLKKLLNLKGPYSGYTPLHWAIHDQDRKMAEWLLDNGADINSISVEEKETPLHLAVRIADKEEGVKMAKFLLKRGAKIDKKDRYDYTPLHVAVFEDKLELVKFFIKEGAKVNTLGDGKTSVLHTAAEFGRDIEIVKALLEAGAKPNRKNSEGRTPYDIASWYEQSDRHPEIAELLESVINKKKKGKLSSKCGSAVSSS